MQDLGDQRDPLRSGDDRAGTGAADNAPAETQAQMAYRIIEEMIVTLRLAPGSLVSEKSMSNLLGIGRTPIREALQRLAFEGTVRILPRAGVIVSEIDVADQLKLIEVRREVEKILAGRAARLADSKTRAAFHRLAADFERAAQEDNEKLFIAADREFNGLIATTAQNSYATHAIGPIEAQTRRFWYLHFERFGDLQRVCGLHARIAHSIGANDEHAARQASDDLLDYVEWYTKLTLDAMR